MSTINLKKDSLSPETEFEALLCSKCNSRLFFVYKDDDGTIYGSCPVCGLAVDLSHLSK